MSSLFSPKLKDKISRRSNFKYQFMQKEVSMQYSTEANIFYQYGLTVLVNLFIHMTVPPTNVFFYGIIQVVHIEINPRSLNMARTLSV